MSKQRSRDPREMPAYRPPYQPAPSLAGSSPPQPKGPQPVPPLVPLWLAVMLGLVLVFGLVLVATLSRGPTNSIQTAQHATPTAPATPSGPQPLDGPTLGGTLAAFDDACGIGRLQGNKAEVQSALQGTAVDILLSLAGGTDGGMHVNYVTITPFPASDTWSAAAALMLSQVFLPPDATRVTDAPFNGTVDHVYLSQRLAATFNPSQFTTDSGQSTTPGTHDIVCIPRIGGAGVAFCDIAPGRH
jgi:hypothetical protein